MTRIKASAWAGRDWLLGEDQRLMECAIGMQHLSAIDLADELERDALPVLRRILDSEIPEMVGFVAEPGSEEEAEFLAVGLGGAPLPLLLQWCTATEDQADRPEWDEVAMYLTDDLRPALALAREMGLWLTSASQIDSLVHLANQPAAQVRAAVAAVVDRIDALTPEVVALQLAGALRAEAPVDWARIASSSSTRSSSASPKWPRRGRRSARAGRARRPRRATSGRRAPAAWATR